MIRLMNEFDMNIEDAGERIGHVTYIKLFKGLGRYTPLQVHHLV